MVGGGRGGGCRSIIGFSVGPTQGERLGQSRAHTVPFCVPSSGGVGDFITWCYERTAAVANAALYNGAGAAANRTAIANVSIPSLLDGEIIVAHYPLWQSISLPFGSPERPLGCTSHSTGDPHVIMWRSFAIFTVHNWH